MAWTERTDLRGRAHKIFEDAANPRKKQLVTAVHDLHYHDGTAWQDVDENFVAETGTFAHQCVKCRHGIHIGTTGTRRWMPRRDHPTEYIEFGRLQSWSGTAWGNVNLGTATRTANKISWTSTNFDLSLTNNWRKVKIDAVLKTEAARRRLRWAVTLSGLTYNNGDLTAISDSVIVGHVEKPIAWDANGSINDQNVAITTTYSGGFIEFGGDLSAAVLPITIDPTLTSQPDNTAGLDTVIMASLPTMNLDGYDFLAVGGDATGGLRTLIKFDLSSIPSDATINSTTLSLWYYGYVIAGDDTIRIYRQYRAWVENQATWNIYSTGNNWQTAGGFGADDCDQSSIAELTILSEAAYEEKQWDISGSTKASIDSGNGWLIKEASEGNHYKRFRDSNYSTTTQRPKLVVDYTEAGGSPYTMAADQAAFTHTGQGANLLFGRHLDAAYATFAHTGQDAALLYKRIMAAAQASYTLSGQDVTLTKIGSYILEAAQAAFTHTGQAANLLWKRVMGAFHTTFALTANDAGLFFGRFMAAAQASFTLTGNDATLTGIAANTLVAARALFTMAGQAANLLWSGMKSGDNSAAIFMILHHRHRF